MQQTGSRRVIRAMANAAAEIGKSYTPWFAAPDAVTTSKKRSPERLFDTFGQRDEVFRKSADQLPDGSGRDRACLSGAAGAQPDATTPWPGPAADVARRAVTCVVVDASQLIGKEHSVDELLARRSAATAASPPRASRPW